ncbi:hypothetical protein BH10ACT3_BH10ACT3_07530 [soil metagenome]
MGMFKDYQSIKKQSKELSKNYDVTSSMGNMQAQLEALNASMAPVAQGLAISQGVVGTATITSMQHTGAMINSAPACELGLLVMVPGLAPFPVTRNEIVPPMYISRALPGQSVSVRVMANDPSDLFIDWAAV